MAPPSARCANAYPRFSFSVAIKPDVRYKPDVGKKEVESQVSEAARMLRAIKSEKRSEASRVNGSKGGRPKKK